MTAGGESVALACSAMGTRFELVLPLEAGADRAALRSAGEEALEEVQRWHGLLSIFDPASVVARINRQAQAGTPVLVPGEVAELIHWCKAASRATGGAFDPSVGALMRIAGFRDAARGEQGALPLAAAMMSGVELEEGDGAWRVRFTSPGVALDFGAVGKGWAIDRGVELLRGAGVKRALLHGGTSSIATIGDCGDGPWKIRLAGPAGNDGGLLDFVDRAMGMSAPSGRTVTDSEGRQHGHVLDPRTGRSAGGVSAAIVSGALAAVCDAWSTALLVEPALAESTSWPAGYSAMIHQEPDGWRIFASGRSVPSDPSNRPPAGV